MCLLWFLTCNGYAGYVKDMHWLLRYLLIPQLACQIRTRNPSYSPFGGYQIATYLVICIVILPAIFPTCSWLPLVYFTNPTTGISVYSVVNFIFKSTSISFSFSGTVTAIISGAAFAVTLGLTSTDKIYFLSAVFINVSWFRRLSALQCFGLTTNNEDLVKSIAGLLVAGNTN